MHCSCVHGSTRLILYAATVLYVVLMSLRFWFPQIADPCADYDWEAIVGVRQATGNPPHDSTRAVQSQESDRENDTRSDEL